MNHTLTLFLHIIEFRTKCVQRVLCGETLKKLNVQFALWYKRSRPSLSRCNLQLTFYNDLTLESISISPSSLHPTPFEFWALASFGLWIMSLFTYSTIISLWSLSLACLSLLLWLNVLMVYCFAKIIHFLRCMSREASTIDS